MVVRTTQSAYLGGMHERVRVLYSGRVQGVGFRWTVQHLSQGFVVTGFVRNLDDGNVELVAEGEAAELDRFRATIAERMQGNIRDETVARSPATGQFARFEIAH
ncbi:MAG: acylphosphatase [Pirellulaceae bacterium]|nr:acylphosphatase [Pirellulaceae bacterium]